MNDKVEKRKRMTHDYSIITIHFLSSYIALMLNSYFRFLEYLFYYSQLGNLHKRIEMKKEKKKINKFLMMRTEKGK